MEKPVSVLDNSGNIAVMTALALTLLTGVVGAATLFVQGQDATESMQASLDAAVLAGTALGFGSSDEARIHAAQQMFAANINKSAKGSGAAFSVTQMPKFVVNLTEVSGEAIGKIKNSLGATIGISSLDVRVSATAQKLQSDPLCVLALNRTQPASIEIYGNAQFNARDCAALANSSNGTGLKIYGNQSSAVASQFGVAGGFSGDSWTPEPQTGADPVVDPFASLPVPSAGACADVASKLKKSAFTLDPGTYCGGLDIMAGSTVTLNPGIYVIKDGQFAVGSGAKVIGNEVMISLVGADSYLLFKSDSSVKLTSPMDGAYKNIQFMSDRDLSQSKFQVEWSTILSGATLDYDGVMYLPEQQLWVSGTGHDTVINANSPSLSMIADKIWVQGNAVFEITQLDRRGMGDVVQAPSFGYGAKLVN